ncbi:MAG: hypothetical protein J6D19_02285 [Clostridia bacterium]|nr:hypothetical protein [Clostridia bacterium]
MNKNDNQTMKEMNANDRSLKIAVSSLTFNIAFAIYHIVLGLITISWWLLTLGSYYLILSLVRFVVVHAKAQERFITKFTGWMLIALSLPLVGTVILSVVKDRGYALHMIVMIVMAAYAFTKITLATIKLIKSRRSNSAMLITLRNISFADAFVSIFALQRSMLVSFEGMSETEIIIMNAALGSAVCVIVVLLGIHLLKSEKSIRPNQSSHTRLKSANNHHSS